MKLSLKQKIVIPLLISVILSGITGFLFFYDKLNCLTEIFIRDRIQKKITEIEMDIKNAGEEALKKAAIFTKLDAVITAYEMAHKGNINDAHDPLVQAAREKLRHDLKSALEGFKTSSGSILKLHFHLPNGRSLVRMWRKKQSWQNGRWIDISDDISGFRKTVLEVNASGKPVHGIELGRGGFVIRGLAPIKSKVGRQLGSVEVLVDFDLVLKNDVKKGEALLLYMNADKLSITTKLQNPRKYPVLDGKFVLVTMTGKAESDDKAKKIITSGFLAGGLKNMQFKEIKNYAIGVFPVNDFKKARIGVIAFYLDITSLKTTIHSVILIFCMVMGAILILIVVINYITLVHAIIIPIKKISDNLQANAHRTNIASGQISSSGKIIAAGVSDAVVSIEQTSASVEKISSMIRQNAQNAAQVDGLMKKVGEKTTSANESMQKLITSMEDINKASKETFKIIKSIEEIVFQTNLLALNAAVEAARAGESGAGFAVVASEVRNLAIRASDAAKITSEQIETIVSKIEYSFTNADNTEKIFRAVTKNSEHVANLVNRIATACKSQAEGIEKINKALMELENPIRYNAASAKQFASASVELSQMSAHVEELSKELISLISGEDKYSSIVKKSEIIH